MRTDFIHHCKDHAEAAIGAIAFQLGLKTEGGDVVDNITKVRAAFGDKRYKGHTDEDLKDMMRSLHIRAHSAKLDHYSQKDFMGTRGLFYMGPNGEPGRMDIGGCFTQVANDQMNQVLASIRKLSMKHLGFAVVTRSPTADNREKFDVSEYQHGSYLLKKKGEVPMADESNSTENGELSITVPSATSVSDLEHQIQLLQEQKQLLLESSSSSSSGMTIAENVALHCCICHYLTLSYILVDSNRRLGGSVLPSSTVASRSPTSCFGRSSYSYS